MKGLFLILFLAGVLDLFGQNPPNGVLIEKGKYLDKTEIATIHYQEFMHFVEQDSTLAYYNSIVPDTTILSQLELRNPENRYLPIIGLNRWQMEQYCQWRTIVVNWRGFNLTYRLPTQAEWMKAFELGGKRPKKAKDLEVVKLGRGKFKHMDSNLSELLYNIDAVLGNNWRNTNPKLDILLHVDANRGHDWVGFRCIAIMKD